VSGLFIAVVVILVVISKIRRLASDAQSSGGAERYRNIRTRIEAKGGDDQPFSLQQVLAEIEKVKNQAQSHAGSPSEARDKLRARIESARRDRPASTGSMEKWRALGRDPEETGVAAGPMGRPSTRADRVADESGEGQDVEHPAGFQALATKAGAAERVVADQAAAATQVPAAPAPRFKVAELRNALVWREILSVPVSMRDE
jgi:alkanesulfonate monooxygenase SsuD/methylene tetrahydromethanopterin reductase-like flavin-dependent oxidoreductase (luciferase family)